MLDVYVLVRSRTGWYIVGPEGTHRYPSVPSGIYWYISQLFAIQRKPRI